MAWETVSEGDVIGVLRGKFAGIVGLVETVNADRVTLSARVHDRIRTLTVLISKVENLDYIEFGHEDHGYPSERHLFFNKRSKVGYNRISGLS